MPTTVSGVDLLEIPPTAGWPRPSSVERPADTIATPPGIVLETTTAAASTTHTLEWGCATRADLVALEAVLDARKGRRVPLWIPTYQRDVEVSYASVTGWIVAKRADGADLGSLVASLPSWQWWFSSPSGGATWRVWHFTSVTDNLDGTETWNGSTPTGAAPLLTTADLAVFSRLVYCRMASDRYTVRYLGQASVVTAEFVEVAAEAP